MNPNQNSHNLDIHAYSLDELFQLFEIQNPRNLSIQDLKRAKKKYQLLHPDKSNLPQSYFIFYQKAYQKIEDYYLYLHPTSRQPQNQTQSSQIQQQPEPLKYQSFHQTDKKIQKSMENAMQYMSPAEFNQRMNQLFEENMASKTQRTDWMKQDQPIFENLPQTISTPEQLTNAMNQLKQQSQTMLIRHRSQDPQHIGIGGYRGAQLYDEDETEEDESIYVSSDPFSKLKYEDLRKVHGAETIFAEPDTKELQFRPKTIEEQQKTRSQTLTPMEKANAIKQFEEQERARQIRDEKIRKNAFQKTESYAEKNQAILASFLRIGNGS